jgi:hypothetical protein
MMLNVLDVFDEARKENALTTRRSIAVEDPHEPPDRQKSSY